MTTAQRHLKLAYWRRILAWNEKKLLGYPQSKDAIGYRKRVAEAKQRIHELTNPPRPKATGVSRAGVDLIRGFEGYVGHPYQDDVGVWTIGYGHTAGVSRASKPISEAEASALLQKDLNDTYVPPVLKLGVPLTQNQVDALVSFVYNLGPGYLQRGHTMGDALAARDYNAAADAFLLYDKAGGRALPGLTRRRKAERALFLSK